jgi:hypothetical protein
MSFTRVRVPHILPLALLACAAIVPVGCGGPDPVESYKAPKSTEREKKDLGGEAGEYRMFGAMYPADNPVWFFKFSGPANAVSKYEEDFDKILASVKFTGEKLDFTAPAGWQRGGGRAGGVVATAKTPDGKYEVSLTHLPGMAAGVEGNLNRWVKQIGLKPGLSDVATYTKNIESNGVKGVRVDLKGPNDPATKGMPPFAGGGMPAGHP